MKEDVFEALEQVAGSLIGLSLEQLLLELLSDGVTVLENALSLDFFFRAFLVEIAAVFAVSFLSGQDPMRTLGLEGAVFESVDEEIEGAGGGGLIGLEAGHAGESGLASEVFGESINAGLFEQGHEDQGTQHGDGIEGGGDLGG